MATKILKKIHKEKVLVWLLSLSIAASFILYMFLVNGAVLNVVAREEVENNLATLNAQVSELEFEYISLKNSITIQYAYDRGFEDVDQVAFAERSESSSLSLNTRE